VLRKRKCSRHVSSCSSPANVLQYPDFNCLHQHQQPDSYFNCPAFRPFVRTLSRHAVYNKAAEERDSLDGSTRPSLAIRDAPGAGLVMWAESSAGALELERPYARSATLDGDAVVVFMRALCAVSQEELESGSSVTTAAAAAPSPGSPRSTAAAGLRLYSLQKVVECAYANMSRIRLVWHKLWAVIAAQLVGASCHPHR
jgi:hypothetical protein